MATRRPRVHPLAIGLIPPSGLFRPISVAPKKNGRADGIMPPDIMKLVNPVRELTKEEAPPPEKLAVRSLRC